MRATGYDGFGNTRTGSTTTPPTRGASVERLEDRRLMSGVVYADFDGDGAVDGADFLALKADQDGDSDGADFLAVIRPGNGDGTFGPAQPVSLDGAPGRVHALGAGDFNGDGQIDLLTAGTYGRGVNERGIIGVLIGHVTAPTSNVPTGTVTFAKPVLLQTAAGAVRGQPVVGDWNGDGRDDIAFANRQRGVLVGLLLPAMSPPAAGEGPAAPLVVRPVDVDLLGWSAGRVAAGDLNGDGRDDLAYVGGPERSLHLLENLGGGRWLDKSSPKLIRLEEVLISSVTDNGTDDLVVLRDGRAHTFEGDPQHLLGLHVTTSDIDAQLRSAAQMVLADVDGDGHADLFSPVPKNRPLLAFGDGAGGFTLRR